MAVNTNLLYAGPVDQVLIGSTDIGGTFDGVVITRDDERMDILCDQVFAPVRKPLTSRKFTVVVNCAELSLANLTTALGQPAGNLTSSSIKLDETDAGQMSITLVVNTPTGVGHRYIKFDLAYIGGSSEHSYKKGVQTFIPVTMECVASSTGIYGYIKDEA